MERGTAESNKVSVTPKDRISNLPEHIIHEILSQLTVLDVARTSCLSKAWKKFCLSLPCLNIDPQDFDDLPYDRFKNFVHHKVRSMSIMEESLVIHKFKLHIHYNYLKKAAEEIEDCLSLVSKTNTIKEFDLRIMDGNLSFSDAEYYWYDLSHHIYNAKTLMVLKLRGLTVTQPFNRDIKFSHLEILRLEDVRVKRNDIISLFFASCPLIREVALVNCDGLEHLKVCGNLCHLKLLEIGFCLLLKSVEIQVPSLEKLVLSEIERRREDEFRMDLSIDPETSETLRELTLCNSSISGLTFTRMFSRCSNVESLVLDRCLHFFKIKIASQKLRKLVMRKCFDLLVTDIEAPNLISFSFCNFLSDFIDCSYSTNPKFQYCDEISQLQESLLDFNQLLWSKNIWISLWFDKFKDSAGQKMVFYPKNYKCYDVVVLEDWSSMAELALMTQISEGAKRTIITTMSFDDLADYVFGDYGKLLRKVLTISFTDKSRLFQVILEKKPQISCKRCSPVVITKVELDAFSFTTCCPSFSRIAATSKANAFSITPIF